MGGSGGSWWVMGEWLVGPWIVDVMVFHEYMVCTTLYNGEQVRCCACDTQTNTHVKLVQIAVF